MIRPIGFSAGGITVLHEELGHVGTIPWADVNFAPAIGGGVDQHYIVLDCPEPGCDASSLHPVGGGGAKREVQRLFAHRLKRAGPTLPPALVTKLGLSDGDVSTWDLVKDKVRQLVTKMDGPGRFAIGDVNENDPVT